MENYILKTKLINYLENKMNDFNYFLRKKIITKSEYELLMDEFIVLLKDIQEGDNSEY